MHKPWAAVRHRFFAISHRRGLWLNEEFLFLAQAVESLHRARSGDTDGKGIVDRAAKAAYLDSPAELQELLGDRGNFIRLFRKTRNYWTPLFRKQPLDRPSAGQNSLSCPFATSKGSLLRKINRSQRYNYLANHPLNPAENTHQTWCILK